ncbi:hypothetical protein [uncultured Phascolarctobacterium sp.]|uniref:hypothetical protein n=1 Tax=uncultured Phascolarctobacterium sp. TaxID=512296 RepID=UPI0027DB7412|nr:hypothetical protein [uncultured Phascolarctobacterium sp.]
MHSIEKRSTEESAGRFSIVLNFTRQQQAGCTSIPMLCLSSPGATGAAVRLQAAF